MPPRTPSYVWPWHIRFAAEGIDIEAHPDVPANAVSDAAAAGTVVVDAPGERRGAGSLRALVVQPVPRAPRLHVPGAAHLLGHAQREAGLDVERLGDLVGEEDVARDADGEARHAPRSVYDSSALATRPEKSGMPALSVLSLR